MARAIFGWGSDPMTGEFPWLRIVWNLLWFMPIQATRFLFVAVVFVSHGTRDAKTVWRDTQ